MSQQAFYFDGTRCTGCKTCQMACKDYKDLSVGLSFRHVYEVTVGDTVKNADGAVTTTCVSYPLSMSWQPLRFSGLLREVPAERHHQGRRHGSHVHRRGEVHRLRNVRHRVPVQCAEGGRGEEEGGSLQRVRRARGRGREAGVRRGLPARALDFGDAEEMAKMGERGNIAPLPDPSETTPNIFIKASADAQPVGAAEIANPLEVA